MRKTVYPKKIMSNRRITAADEPSKLQTAIDRLKDDFDYVLEGLDYLDRTGAEASNQGLVVAERLQGALDSAIQEIAEV